VAAARCRAQVGRGPRADGSGAKGVVLEPLIALASLKGAKKGAESMAVTTYWQRRADIGSDLLRAV
jgi:hypothetical protein